ncbi:Hypothetical protein R9X50_00717400 [Acrodontium crateriforme]|uniref:RanBP2-type domain-containing protein n=1 Tax=Acrodontium crateriforme TaxID=150365 RepID=A0AAQ3MAK5_9PEZI|nr:Hypothetical protein R9X50_00717400 [Acrodontium crateriforme]
MPLGFERVNERTQRPNANINFIKPLATTAPADQKIAQDFLERIAAQCFPIMKKHYLYVMALEEFPVNNEFLGRNFNAGEVIQLVLKDKSGRWLSFKFVQMVMMHELAHCKQMNHSKFFWKERNLYADNMKELWQKGYLGEGLWGRGKDLMTGQHVHDRMPEQAEIPEHLCGGTYRRARCKKRKRGNDGADEETTTYAERQQKRIARKFGNYGDGNALGEDDLVRGALEQGKRHYGKPKVAQSKRGRELRANAALARFEAAKNQAAESSEASLKGENSDSDWCSDDDDDDDDNFGTPGVIASESGLTANDGTVGSMVQVCGDEGETNKGGQNEIDELRMISSGQQWEEVAPKKGISNAEARNGKPTHQVEVVDLGDDSETESEASSETGRESNIQIPPVSSVKSSSKAENAPSLKHSEALERSFDPTAFPKPPEIVDHGRKMIPQPQSSATATLPLGICQICSLENESDSVICMACSHVLKPSLMRNHWRCTSDACKGTKYINPGDAGRCGVCGAQKPIVTDSRPVGVVSADVLRWD